jgi:simple sugar transport system permease protein
MNQLIKLFSSFLALGSALTVVAFGLWASGYSALDVFSALLAGAGGDAYRISETFVKSGPLLFTGLSVALALQAGLWNIGAEGQLLIGALMTAWLGQYTASLPPALAILCICVIAALGGALWATCAAMLKNIRAVNEVISTIMLNFIAAGLVSYCVQGHLMETGAQYPQTNSLPASAQLPRLFPPTRLHLGIPLAILTAVSTQFFLFRTGAGFKLRAPGATVIAAGVAGINGNHHMLFAFAISGALSGLAGGIEVSSITHRVYEKFSPGYGYTAIAVALVGQRSPLGVILAALFFGALEAGSGAVQRVAGISSVIVSVIQGVVILFLAACSTDVVQSFLWKKYKNSALL